jgi:predicted nucleotidyltransferase
VHEQITDRRREIADLCRQYHVRRLAIFGSALRRDFDPERSDIDLLVEFEPLATNQYAENYFALLQALTELFARKVDLLVWRSIKNPYFLREIESSQEVLYAA